MLSQGSSSFVHALFGLRFTTRFFFGASTLSAAGATAVFIAGVGAAAGFAPAAGPATTDDAAAGATGATTGFCAGAAVAAGAGGAIAGFAAGAAGAALSCARADADTARSSAIPRVCIRVIFASQVSRDRAYSRSCLPAGLSCRTNRRTIHRGYDGLSTSDLPLGKSPNPLYLYYFFPKSFPKTPFFFSGSGGGSGFFATGGGATGFGRGGGGGGGGFAASSSK